RSVARADDVHAGAFRPDLELFDSGRPERVGSANQRLTAFRLQQVRQLPDRRRLSGAVDADDEYDFRRLRDGNRRVDRAEDAVDLAFDQVAEARAVTGLCLHGRDDGCRRRHAEVGGNQQLFERVERVDVERARSLLGRVGTADDLIELLDDLLFGAGKTLANA